MQEEVQEDRRLGPATGGAAGASALSTAAARHRLPMPWSWRLGEEALAVTVSARWGVQAAPAVPVERALAATVPHPGERALGVTAWVEQA